MTSRTPEVAFSPHSDERFMNRPDPRPDDIHVRALRALFVGVSLLLFALWMMSQNQNGTTPGGAGSQCKSMGRGGLLCEPQVGASATGGSADDVCISLGRGRKSCPAASEK